MVCAMRTAIAWGPMPQGFSLRLILRVWYPLEVGSDDRGGISRGALGHGERHPTTRLDFSDVIFTLPIRRNG
ncbi:MAG TPA: hypothetical protein VJR48_03505 [Ktedonobacterales bacterium]|nr:hypothetical protein [Ktedonobacterales bacterium]